MLDGQQLNVSQLSTVSGTLPFLGETRLIIIRGLLARFESGGKPDRRTKVKKTNRKDSSDDFVPCLINTPDSTIIALLDGVIKDSNPLLKELKDKAKVRRFPFLRNDELSRWIKERVVEENGRISPQAVSLLARLVGSNLWVMANEINKLVLFNSGKTIGPDDVTRLVSCVQQANVFAMVDAILESRAGAAEQVLQQLLQRGAYPTYLLAMLSRQVQMIVRAKDLRAQRKTMAEMKSRLGLTSEFAMRKTLEQSSKYSFERIREVYHQLLEADISIKTGKYDGELALSILVAELCQ